MTSITAIRFVGLIKIESARAEAPPSAMESAADDSTLGQVLSALTDRAPVSSSSDDGSERRVCEVLPASFPRLPEARRERTAAAVLGLPRVAADLENLSEELDRALIEARRAVAAILVAQG